MADRDHPKTHVEDQDLKKPRKQPLSPQREGIDPLTESDTMYSAENVKADAEKLRKKQASAAEGSALDTDTDHQTLEDHTDVTNQPSPEQPASESNEPADKEQVESTNTSNSDVDQDEQKAAEEIAENTEPGQPDDDTPDAGEKEEDQEPHTDKVNTSPANRTTSTKSPKPRKG